MSASSHLATDGRNTGVRDGNCLEPGRLHPIRAIRAETVTERPELNSCCLRLGRACAALLLLAGAASAQRDLKDIPAPDVQAEMDAFELADGFEVNLFAADPVVVKPIQMNWDERGRLWVCGSSIYPHIEPGQQAGDKIVILEDTDGDGRADKHTIFADNLHIPTGILPGDGGVYVANSTEILHLSDTDGDGKADHRRILLSGFGVEDVHHMIHTFRWGMDGHLYFNQSIYTHSHVETPWGVKRLRAGGFWRLRPESLELEVFGRGGVNPWGHQYDRWGQSFMTDGAFAEGINYLFPGAAFIAADGVRRLMNGLNPGQPKHCGLEIVSGSHMPEEWQGHLLTADYRANRINRFVLSDEGSGFSSRQVGDLIASNHVSFRPVDIRMGPDGAIYVADWYNPIIQHGEVDFRDPRRDHDHGRIWRITAKDRPLVSAPKLVGASVEELLEGLKSQEGWTREQARRLLKERGAAEVAPALETWIEGLAESDPERELHRLQALWVFQALDEVREPLLGVILAAQDFRVRAAGVRVLSDWHDRLDHSRQLLAGALADEAPRVRLEGLHAARKFRDAHTARLALMVSNAPMDTNLDYALALTLEDLLPAWLPALQRDPTFFGPDARGVIVAAKAVHDPEVLSPLLELYRQDRVATDLEDELLELIASRGDAEQLETVSKLAFGETLSADRRARLLVLLDTAARRGVVPAGNPAEVLTLLGAADPKLIAGAARLAGRWQLEPARGDLDRLANDADADGGIRDAALDALALLGGDASVRTLEDIARSKEELSVRVQAVASLATVDVARAAATSVQILGAAKGAEQDEVAGVFDAFLRQSEGPAALAEALANADLPTRVALLGLRRLDFSGVAAPDLKKALTEAGGEIAAPSSLDEDQLEQLVHEVAVQGDPVRGEAIYRLESQACQQCHAIGGAGGRFGPDLSGIGSSAPVDYLIEALLEPDKQIKEGFHGVIIRKKDNTVATGIAVRATDREVVLLDASDTETVIPRDQIAEDKLSDHSLMPATPLALRRDQLVDLARFLSELGREGPYRVSPARVVRRWQVPVVEGNWWRSGVFRHGVMHAVQQAEMLEWVPRYSHTSGELPLADVPRLAYRPNRELSLVRFELRVSTAGQIGLWFNSTDGLELFVDGDQLELPQENTAVDLSAGNHWITLVLHHENRDGVPLRVELFDVPGSAGRAQRVVGR